MKRHKVRARILQELYNEEYQFRKLPDDETRGTDFEIEMSLAISEIAKRTGFAEKFVETQIQFLDNQKEVQYISNGPDGGWYLLTALGKNAYADDKYVKLENEERMGFWGKRVTIVATLGTLLVSTVALGLNWYSTYKTSSGIEKVNTKIDSIEAKVNSMSLPKQK